MLSQEHPLVVNLPQLSHDKFYQAFLLLNFWAKGSTVREEGLGTRLLFKHSSFESALAIYIALALGVHDYSRMQYREDCRLVEGMLSILVHSLLLYLYTSHNGTKVIIKLRSLSAFPQSSACTVLPA